MTDFLNTYKTQPAELSVNEVAKILRCSNQMVFKLCLQYKDLSYYKVGNRYMFSPNQNDVPKSAYVKWYSAEQINAIADALPLVYRCIFLDTVYVGHRVGGALSLTLDSVDLYNGTVTPTKSKTGKIHTSYIPAPLIEDMRQYLIEVRRNIATDSNAFFIGRNGKSVTYQAYRMALESARITVNKKYGWNIEALHTHAGRSTFAAALRTYQLDCRRNGIPTFSDVDFCNLMDWKSLDSLKHYDLINRIVNAGTIKTSISKILICTSEIATYYYYK